MSHVEFAVSGSFKPGLIIQMSRRCLEPIYSGALCVLMRRGGEWVSLVMSTVNVGVGTSSISTQDPIFEAIERAFPPRFPESICEAEGSDSSLSSLESSLISVLEELRGSVLSVLSLISITPGTTVSATLLEAAGRFGSIERSGGLPLGRFAWVDSVERFFLLCEEACDSCRAAAAIC